MSDLIERLRDADTTRRIGESYADTHERRQRDRDEAAAEIERLRAEVKVWQGHTKTAVWSDSEECKMLAADNERLRAALRRVSEVICSDCHMNAFRAALEGK